MCDHLPTAASISHGATVPLFPAVIELDTLPAGLQASLQVLRGSPTPQSILVPIADRRAVTWYPAGSYHHSFQLPLLLLSAALDETVALLCWQDLSFVAAIGEAHRLDRDQQDMLRALAGAAPIGRAVPTVSFTEELGAWVDRFDLERAGLVAVDHDRLARGGEGAQYAVQPVAYAVQLRQLHAMPVQQRLGGLALLAIYNSTKAMEMLEDADDAWLDPPAVPGMVKLRRLAGADACAHLLRLIAAYRGW